jgi:hypothetical protein
MKKKITIADLQKQIDKLKANQKALDKEYVEGLDDDAPEKAALLRKRAYHKSLKALAKSLKK